MNAVSQRRSLDLAAAFSSFRSTADLFRSRLKEDAARPRIGRTCVTMLQRTSGCKSRPGKESERPVAGPELAEEIPWAERGVKSLFGGSKCTGRNIK